ncbi:hypothetical protein BCON_0149g00020 [Botryotinia convoluta]|uniref:Uncharacterized protein n=1 Tax=Botryotinia convoluta TaxID=54673 RepID=A0A4Z1HTD3_9HELO|nr:hypothetical protein BCON_0149g00020 [Botryotinia convoluta]
MSSLSQQIHHVLQSRLGSIKLFLPTKHIDTPSLTGGNKTLEESRPTQTQKMLTCKDDSLNTEFRSDIEATR